MLYMDNSKVETAMKATIRYEFNAFGANLQLHYAAFFFFRLWSPVNFIIFFKAMSIKPWTVEELGLSSQKLRTF